jgi:2-hydroxychromene-2-carboxylate isomerase
MKVTLYFDPACPWTWIAYNWLKRVFESRDIKLTLAPLSLALLNDELGGENATRHTPNHLTTHGYLRVIQAVRSEYDDSKGTALYEALAAAWHLQKLRQPDDVLAALEQCGLPATLAGEAKNSQWDKELISNVAEARGLAGKRSAGVPMIAIGENGYFGPLLNALPDKEESVKLWDAIVVLGTSPYFKELKRAHGPSNVGSTAHLY